MKEEKYIKEIRERYEREIALFFPDKVVCHYADCYIFCIGLCTCGLLSSLRWLGTGQKEVYRRWEDDLDIEADTFEFLQEKRDELKKFREERKKYREELNSEDVQKRYDEIIKALTKEEKNK